MTGLRLKDSCLLCLAFFFFHHFHFYHFQGIWFHIYLLFMKTETEFSLKLLTERFLLKLTYPSKM